MKPEDLKSLVFQCRVYMVALFVTVIPLSLAGWTNTVFFVVIPAYLLAFNVFLMGYWGEAASPAPAAPAGSNVAGPADPPV